MKKLYFLFFVFLLSFTATSQSCLPEGKIFSTQSQIDHFSNNYPGCREIEGDVVIQGNDITNVNGLSVLTALGGNFSIGTYLGGNWDLDSLAGLDKITHIDGSFSIIGDGHLINLMGLKSLNSVGGDLIIQGNASLMTLAGLESLYSIGGELKISDNNELTSLMGLENIHASSIADLYIYNNFSLSECQAQSICDYLASPNGTIEIHHNATGCDSLEEVVSACRNGLPEDDLSENQFTITPNPSSNHIIIETTGPQPKFQISIFNFQGQKVMSSQIADHKAVIDISDLPCGVYFVRMTGESAAGMEKFVKAVLN